VEILTNVIQNVKDMFEPDIVSANNGSSDFPPPTAGLHLGSVSSTGSPSSSNDISCWAQDKSGFCWSVNYSLALALAGLAVPATPRLPGHEEAVAYGDSPASYIAHQSSIRTSTPTALVWIPDLFFHTFITGPMTFLLKIVPFAVKVL
jgi:hypothetical protein